MNIRPVRRPPLDVWVWLCLLLPAAFAVASEPPGSSYRRFTHDGAWCWFADPRAVHDDKMQRTYAAWVSGQGDVVVGMYDHQAGSIANTILHRALERDDHAAPSLLLLPDGRVRAFYSMHGDTFMRTRVTQRPGDIGKWEPEQTLNLNNPDELKPGHPNAVCYSHPTLLSDGELVLFWRGTNYKPCMAVSRDLGASFEKSYVAFESPNAEQHNRPYLKASCDDGEVIHIALTTGHPRDESHNSVYYCAFDGRAFRRANGSVIGTTNDLPLDPAECDVVYDGRIADARAWLWDVAGGPDRRPVIVYTRLPAETRHVYYHAAWDGRQWVQRPITDGGAWFPRTPPGTLEREPHYSGGVILDHANTGQVYLARPVLGVFEIERWELSGSGAGWRHAAITSGSQYDNVRPVAIRNAPASGPRLLWMCVDRQYEHYTRYGCSIRMDQPEPPRTTDALNPATIRQIMERVGRWQLANPASHPAWDWTQGALYAGLMALVRVSDDPQFEQALLKIGRGLEWKPGPRPFFADDHCVGQVFLELNLRHRDEAMLAPIRATMDAVAAQPAAEPLLWANDVHLREWAWCDALFMAPPTLARLYAATGDECYLHEIDRRWWKATDYLYDRDERLYYRDSRYFDQREANGRKVFWSRGNGWVLAGLARVLQVLPQTHPTRPRYEQLFVEMSSRLSEIQQPDGLWRSSLLDPASYPHAETSGSGFNCFALAWGVNAGLLERDRFQPVVERAWMALIRCVDANGMLEWVQPIGEDPRHVRAANTDVYGVGAFLLAGEQVRQMIEASGR
ncbi:MAG: glycoside hydrolase family 88 protein [Planctomycetes bacterium]|nr:glycoside hydrolase family 88 protein [Planctomycetota bacterium]